MSVWASDREEKPTPAQGSEGFHEFLAWLDGGASETDSEGASYLRMRDRLVEYFDRRNCVDPDELADETLNRAARRLAEEGKIATDSPAKYCYTLARYVLLEYFRSSRAREIPLEDARSLQPNAPQFTEEDEKAVREGMLACLEKCTAELPTDQRQLVFAYYQGEQRAKIENRRRWANALGISVNALCLRAYRIRERLEKCVKRCTASS